MTLEYLREYWTYFHLGRSYGLSESACYRACRYVEDILIKSGEFSLPEKKEHLKSDVEYEVILIDASETPVAPQKKVRDKKRIKNRNNRQKHFYLGKKKRHTLKTKIVVDKKTKRVICTAFSSGKKHDFKLFGYNSPGPPKVRCTSMAASRTCSDNKFSAFSLSPRLTVS